jgi:hypothetical protein
MGTVVEVRDGLGPTLLFTTTSPHDIKACLRGGADPNKRRSHGGKTALMIACSKGLTDVACAMLSFNTVDPHLKDQFSKTAMDYALAACGGPGDAIARVRHAELHPLVRALQAYVDSWSAGEEWVEDKEKNRSPTMKHQLNAWRPAVTLSPICA